jgi:hypothetical protein
MSPLTLTDLRQALDIRVTVASAKSPAGNRVVLDYRPLRQDFVLYEGAEPYGIYTCFAAQMAIDGFNMLVNGSLTSS